MLNWSEAWTLVADGVGYQAGSQARVRWILSLMVYNIRLNDEESSGTVTVYTARGCTSQG